MGKSVSAVWVSVSGVTEGENGVVAIATGGRHGREQRESPRTLRSRDLLRASLTPFAPVLTASVFPEGPAPFIPARVGSSASLCGRE